MQKLSEELQYLTSEQVGKVIYEGLSVVYEDQPEHPVSYLANWLLNHCVTENNKHKEKSAEIIRKQLIVKHEDSLKQAVQEQQKQEELTVQKEKVITDFRTMLTSHSYLEELLDQEFPDFINQSQGLPAVYVGYQGYPLKPIEEGDEDPNAHLDMTQEKLIRYIGASKDQRFIIGNQLLPETGVTYDVLKPKEEEEAEPEEEEGQEGVPKPPKHTYLYVPDVTKEPRMTYFRIPRLGAYIACNLTYKSVLNETAFDEGVKERQRVQVEKAEQQKEKEAKDAEFQQRIEDAQDDGQDTNEIEEEWKNYTWEEIKEKDFEFVPQEYVLCADTLGEDREIPEDQRNYLEDLANFFVKCWEESEQQQLSNDINMQIKYLSEFNKEEFIDEFNNRIEDEVAEKARETEEGEEEHDHDQEPTELKENYRQSVAKTEAYKRALLEDADLKGHLMALKDYRVVKFQGIIQTALIMIGYNKEEINQPDTNLLNWKKVRHLIGESDFYDRLALYRYRGSKPGQVKPYAYTNRILKRLDGYTIEEIDDFNIGLGLLYRFLKQVLETRIMDVQVRKEDKTLRRAKRERLIQDAEDRQIRHDQELEDARTQILEDEAEDEEFNVEEWQVEWERQWEEENPPIVIPDEVEDDIDEDIEPEEEAQETE